MVSRKINLLHVVLEMGIGGLQRLITDTTLAMDRDRFNVEVVCLDELGCFAEVLQANGVPVTLLRRHDHHLALYPIRLARFMRQRKIDVVHMHPGSFIFGILAAVLARVPVSVYTEHGRAVPEHPLRILEDRVSGVFVDRIIAVSKELEVYLAEAIKLPPKKICTVINGIRVSEFVRRPKDPKLLSEFGISPETKVLGTVARLDPIKDQLTMVQALKVVRERVPNVRLLLVGDGPARGDLEALALADGLENYVTITGQRSDVPGLVNLFDLFLLSSLREGTSISLLEAMSSGVAPIVTNVGGNPAIVSDGVDGLLVPPRDPQALASAIIELLVNETKRKTFAEAAAAKVREQFSIENMVRQYVEIYCEHLAKKRRSRHLVQSAAGRS
ncbi:MAG: glycosyltransferase [bacterium]|nr:glycosyltransferase [bacterium]